MGSYLADPADGCVALGEEGGWQSRCSDQLWSLLRSGSTEKQIYKYTYIVHSGTDQRWATLAQRHTAKAARQETSFL